MMYTEEEVKTFESIITWNKIMPQDYWTKEQALKIFDWVINEKLKWGADTIARELGVNRIASLNLNIPFRLWFNGSPWLLINELYPDKFKPWELNVTPKKYWNMETGISAIKWLFEDVLKCKTDEDFIRYTTVETFWQHRLRGMLVRLFNGSPYAAINAAYPDRFKREQFGVRLGVKNDKQSC
jgi:hypothetical protein